MHAHSCLTVLQCLHQCIRISQCSEVDESLRDPVVCEHSEPVHVDDVSLSSGLHDAPEISHQDLSSLVERDSLPLKQTGATQFLHRDNVEAPLHVE